MPGRRSQSRSTGCWWSRAQWRSSVSTRAGLVIMKFQGKPIWPTLTEPDGICRGDLPNTCTGHFPREPSLIAGTMWTRLSTLARWDIVNKICILSAFKTKVQMWVYWTQVWSLLCLVCNCYLQLILTHKDVFNSSIALTGEHLFKEQRRNLFWSKLLKSIEYNWTSSFMEYQKWRSRPCSNAK